VNAQKMRRLRKDRQIREKDGDPMSGLVPTPEFRCGHEIQEIVGRDIREYSFKKKA